MVGLCPADPMDMRGHVQGNMHGIYKCGKEVYGKAIVVFDGYGGTSTEDMTHQRRTKGQTGVTVTFTEEMQLTMKKLGTFSG